nr:hypothetical protein Iba_chr14fCG5300 [Ipomoea batatas]
MDSKVLTREIPEIRLNTIAVNVHVIWCDILPNSNNYTRPILKLEDRLNQALPSKSILIQEINNGNSARPKTPTCKSAKLFSIFCPIMHTVQSTNTIHYGQGHPREALRLSVSHPDCHLEPPEDLFQSQSYHILPSWRTFRGDQERRLVLRKLSLTICHTSDTIPSLLATSGSAAAALSSCSSSRQSSCSSSFVCTRETADDRSEENSEAIDGGEMRRPKESATEKPVVMKAF